MIVRLLYFLWASLMPVSPIFAAVVTTRRPSLSRSWRASLTSPPHTGTTSPTRPRFVSCVFSVSSTDKSFIWEMYINVDCWIFNGVHRVLNWIAGLLNLVLTSHFNRFLFQSDHPSTANPIFPSGSDHSDAAGRSGAEIHSYAGAGPPVGQRKHLLPLWIKCNY